MSGPRVTFLAHQDEELREWLAAHPDGHERGAILLMRRYRFDSPSLEDSDRYQVTEVHRIPVDWVTSSGADHFAFQNRHLRPFMQRCEERGLTMGLAHSHPSGCPKFSAQDDINERSLLEGLENRNGHKVSFVALVLCDGLWRGRVRYAIAPDRLQPLRHILVLSSPLRIHLDEESTADRDPDIWARQSAAFGEPFQCKIHSLRIGVIGAGGTGSPTFTMLARSGAGELILIDDDTLDKSNLNRVHGARLADVGRPKVEIGRDFIQSLGLGTLVHVEKVLMDTSAAAVDALMTCDVVVGCTDDSLGRSALDALCFRHGVLGIDMGIGGAVAAPIEGAGSRNLRFYQHGRISTLLPGVAGYRCLECEKVYDQEDLRAAQYKRDHPNATDEQLHDAYIKGGHTSAPGVGPFTSCLSNLALMHLYDLIQGFRSKRLPEELRPSNYTVNFVSMEARSSVSPDQECTLCFPDGAARPTGLLNDRALRLGRPSLGEIPCHE